MWSGPAVSQGTAAGHLFISLFARRQCSRLWRRNSIFILSFTVILSCLHQHHRSPNHYPPHTYSSLCLTHILQPFVFLATSVECAKKNIFQFDFASPRLWFFWLSIENPFYISMCNYLKDYWQTHVLSFTQTHVLCGWQVQCGRRPQMESVKGQNEQIMRGFVMREALAWKTGLSGSEGDVFSVLLHECVETLESWSGCTKLWKPGWFGSKRHWGSPSWNEPKATIQRYLSSLFTRSAWGPNQH